MVFKQLARLLPYCYLQTLEFIRFHFLGMETGTWVPGLISINEYPGSLYIYPQIRAPQVTTSSTPDDH